jgi:hypothetical protein
MIRYIPNISYQLVFCFLSFKELALIAQCSKEWNKLSTEPSFLNMTHHEELFIFDKEDKLKGASSSPFRGFIRNSKLEIKYNTISKIYYLIDFPKLVSLELVFSFHFTEYFNLDMISVFRVLGSRLRQLSIKINHVTHQSNHQLNSLLRNLEQSISFLTCLEYLNMNDACSHHYLMKTDFSFLSRLKNLKTFICNFILAMQAEYIANLTNNIKFCSNLTYLDLGPVSGNLNFWSEICESLKHSKLTYIGKFWGIRKELEHKYVEILSTLPYLQSIGIEISTNSIHHGVPTLLGRWIRHLKIKRRILNNEDVNAIVTLSNLKSLVMIDVDMNCIQMQSILEALYSRLEELNFKMPYAYGSNTYPCFDFPFESLTKCIKLKSLELCHIILELDLEKIAFLSNCKKLEIIKFSYPISSNDDELCKITKQTFQIPSSIFPNLKTYEIRQII